MANPTASENRKPEHGDQPLSADQQKQLNKRLRRQRQRQRQRKREKERSALGQKNGQQTPEDKKKKTHVNHQSLRNIKKLKKQRYRQRMKERKRQDRGTEPKQQSPQQNQGPDQDAAASEYSVDSAWEREEAARKAEHEEQTREMEERKREAREFEESKVAEVKRTFGSLRNGQRGPRISIANTHFELFCLEYFDYFYSPKRPDDGLIKFVEFEHQRGNRKDGLPPAGLRRVDGNIYLETEAEPACQPFVVPVYASRNVIQLKSPFRGHEKHEMSVQFISDDHLILYVGREVVFGPRRPPPDVPKVFIFFGIRLRGMSATEEEKEWTEQ